MSNYTSIHVNHFRYLDKTSHGQNEPRLRTKWTTFQDKRGWSGGAKVLGKLSVPGRPTSLDDSRARAYCSCSRCG